MKPLVFLLWMTGMALAHSPEDTDPAMAPWFRSLEAPSTGGSCCNEQDCATVGANDLKSDSGYYWVRDPAPEALVWLVVPKESILKRYDNPTGKPVACIWGHKVMCFIMSAGI